MVKTLQIVNIERALLWRSNVFLATNSEQRFPAIRTLTDIPVQICEKHTRIRRETAQEPGHPRQQDQSHGG